MWCLGTRWSGGLGRLRLTVGLHDLKGLLQPKRFHHSRMLGRMLGRGVAGRAARRDCVTPLSQCHRPATQQSQWPGPGEKGASSWLLRPACPPCSPDTAQSKSWTSHCNYLQGGRLEAGRGCVSFFTPRPAPAVATFKAQLMDAHAASALREQMPAPQDMTRTTNASDKTKAMPSAGALEEHCRALWPPPLQSQGQQL